MTTRGTGHHVRWLIPGFLLLALVGCASDSTTVLGITIQSSPAKLTVAQGQALSGVVLRVEGGSPGAEYYWNLTGTLPPGVTASPADGLTASNTLTFSGTPSTVGSFSFTITLDGPAPSHQQLLTASFTFDILGSSGSPQILTTKVYWPSGISGFEQALSASGGSPTYTWSATLPPNLSLSETGVISGETNLSGPIDVLVTLQDSDGQVDQETIRLEILTVADFLGTWSGVITRGFASIDGGLGQDVTGQRLGLIFDNAGVIVDGVLHATALRRNQQSSTDIRFTFNAPYLGRFNGLLPQLGWHVSCRPTGETVLQLDCIMHYSDFNNNAIVTLSRVSTSSQDTTAPTATSDPADGATDVTSRQMTLDFSEPMSSGSAAILTNGGTIDAVTFSPDGTRATLSFGGLRDFQDYTLTLNPVGQVGFLDLAGNPLAQRVITFRTGGFGTNRPPTAGPQLQDPVLVVHDRSISITLVASDPDSDPLTFTISDPPNGTVTGSGPNVTYTPTAGYVGNDSFTFSVRDPSNATSNTVTVNITVTNQAPTATPQSVSVTVDTQRVITLAGSDLDSDPLTFAIATGPSNGSLSAVTGASVTYTPNATYTGSDSFTFTVRDTANAVSAPAMVSITVRPNNQAPTAGPQPPVSAVHDRSTNITLVASDPDDDPLTYIYSDPPNGTVTGAGPSVTYTPTAGYVGADSFTFRVRDPSNAESGTVTVDITVTNQAPTATPQNVSVIHDRPAAILLASTDPDGDALTYTVSTPTSGTLAGPAPNLTYTPAAQYVGSASFTFSVRDTANATSTPATVNITVTNQAPTATPQSVSVTTNTPRVVTLAGSDADGDSLTYAIASSPSNGSLSAVTGASVTYTPNAAYIGPDSFTFTVRDTANVVSAPATVSLTVTGADATPTAASSGYPYTGLATAIPPYSPPINHRISRRDYTAKLPDIRWVIPLTGSDAEGPVTFELVQYAPWPAQDPTQAAGQLSVRDGGHPMSMVQGQSYLFWNPTLLAWEYRPATYSSTVDSSTGVITVSQPGAQAMVIYTAVTCHFAEDTDDTFTFRVRDSAGQVSSPATITVWHKTGSCSHPP